MTYKLRISGTNNFVSKIDRHDQMCSPPGRVDVVSGWNSECLTFKTIEDAQSAATVVGNIEGFHVSIENGKEKETRP